MADLTSAFKSELFRPVVTLVIPGAIAAGPYMAVAVRVTTGVQEFLESHSGLAWVCGLGVAVAAGLILENIGSRLEASFIDDWLEHKLPGSRATWREYLSLKMTDEFVGQRYLRTVLLRMKFELSMAPAVAIAGLGLGWLQAVAPWGAVLGPVGPILAGGVIAAWFLVEAFSSARVLADTRKLLVIAASPILAKEPTEPERAF